MTSRLSSRARPIGVNVQVVGSKTLSISSGARVLNSTPGMPRATLGAATRVNCFALGWYGPRVLACQFLFDPLDTARQAGFLGTNRISTCSHPRFGFALLLPNHVICHDFQRIFISAKK